jgi:hypothetical protein
MQCQSKNDLRPKAIVSGFWQTQQSRAVFLEKWAMAKFITALQPSKVGEVINSEFEGNIVL